MTHAPKFWAAKLPADRHYKFWELVNAGFGGESAYYCTINHTYG